MIIDIQKETEASLLRGSFLEFTRFFFKHLTGKDFIVSQPICRESHHITIARAYTQLFREQKPAHGLLVNVPPGYGKSVMTSMWIAWCYTHYADCNFLYISYSHDLAAKHTAFVKTVMSSSMYAYLFDVHLSQDSRAKDHFMTTRGGTVAAFGSQGSITGRDAGAPGLPRFSGAVIIDDPIKPDEATSDTIRASVLRNYQETILQRPRDINVPMLFIGQRLHEDDLAAYLASGKDVREWDQLILKGIDDAGNALYPEAQPLDYLQSLQKKQPYVFASQIQQDPIPAGGSVFKPEWFAVLDEEPEMIITFITADTAETDKSYNDASVFSFWGVYRIMSNGKDTGLLGLHWIDCLEIRIEPKDLKNTFMDFYAECSLHASPPLIAAIEKKSTGVTLVSVLDEIRGLSIRSIERNRSSGSKTARFLAAQPLVASKLVSFTHGARHSRMCIDHMSKITANDSHRHDDIADTLCDALHIALVEKTLHNVTKSDDKRKEIMQTMANSFHRKLAAGAKRNAGYS